MQFREILTMALASVGANKLRSALTMLGITIGVFSVISVMTAIGAMQVSIEVNAGGKGSKKYENRRDINYREAQRYAELMEGVAGEVCLKVFDFGKQAVYNGVKTTSDLTVVEPAADAQPVVVTVTEYGPASASVAGNRIGFCTDDVNPFGPVQE